MLSIKSLGSAQAAGHYYSEQDAKYYVKDEEGHQSFSQWYGKGAQLLGLKGAVDKEAFLNVLEGKLPNGTVLGRKQNGELVHAPGLDLTFSCPKSVSIMAEVGGDARITEAFKESVQSTLRYAEQNLIQTRVQEDGKKSIEKVDNLTVAMFTHDTSRNLDPNLHIHCVVANAVRKSNGVWSSPDLKVLFENKMLLGQMQRFELAHRLKSLGYEIEITGRNSLFELKCVPSEVVETFSSRRKEIKEALKNYEYVNAKTAENATLMTRGKKQKVELGALHKEWDRVTKELGFDARLIAQSAIRGEPINQSIETKPIQNQAEKSLEEGFIERSFRKFCEKFEFYFNRTPKHLSQIQEQVDKNKPINEQALDYAVAHISERTSLWMRKDMIQAAMSYSTGLTSFQEIDKRINEMLSTKELLITRDKKTEKMCYTTKAALSKERETIALMKEGASQISSILTKQEIKQSLKDSGLNQGQREAIELILSAKDRVVGIQGYAGTGKTYALQVVKKLLEERGWKAIGLAPSASSASVLQKDSGITSQTIHKFLFRYDGLIHGRGTLEGKKTMRQAIKDNLIVVDEASLASTTQVYSLLKVANELDTRLVLIGDTKQLVAVESGKPFAELQQNGMKTAIMKEIRRQTNLDLKQAVTFSRKSVDNNDRALIEEALTKIGSNFIEDKNLYTAAASLWLSLDMQTRDQTLLVAPSNTARKAINGMVRDALRKEGTLSGQDNAHKVLEGKNFTRAEAAFAKNYRPGDVVLFNRDYRSLKINKNDYYQVKEVKDHNVIILTKYEEQQTLLNKQKQQIAWQPNKMGGTRSGAIEVFTEKSIQIAVGEKLKWTKNYDPYKICNSHLAEVAAVSNKDFKVKLESGEIKKIAKDHLILKHIDHAYAITGHSAQGKTYARVIGILESTHANLTTQRMLYVTLSRAKESATIVTDDKHKLIKTLAANSGAKVSALDQYGAYSHTTKQVQTQTKVAATHTSAFLH